MERPCASAGTKNRPTPLSTAALTTIALASAAHRTAAFKPDRTQPPVTGSARVSRGARDQPTPGSAHASTTGAPPLKAVASRSRSPAELDTRPEIAAGTHSPSRKGTSTPCRPSGSRTATALLMPPPKPPSDSGSKTPRAPSSASAAHAIACSEGALDVAASPSASRRETESRTCEVMSSRAKVRIIARAPPWPECCAEFRWIRRKSSSYGS